MGQFNLHKVKRQARKAAWYQQPGEATNYNPFRKNTTWSHPPREVDIEAGEGNGVPLHTASTAPTSADPDGESAHSPTSARNDDGVELTAQPEAVVDEKDTSGTGRASPSAKPRARFGKKNTSEDSGVTLTKSVTASSKKSKKHNFTVRNQLQNTIFNSWINIFILAAPVGIALYYAKQNGWAVFVVNFIAIIPLAAMLSFATEEIAIRVGETVGGLLNASFGNAVELIVAIIALSNGNDQVILVQTSLVGSILSNLLLVMGMCFWAGGLRRQEQYFNITVAQTAASLLALAVASIIVPTAFADGSNNDANIPDLSRGVAVILLLVYGAYLFFQLHTHQDVFMEQSQKVPMKPRKSSMPAGGIQKGLAQAGGVAAAYGRHQGSDRGEDELVNRTAYEDEENEGEEEEPRLHFLVAMATLAISTAIIAVCADCMVDSINDITAGGGISEEFVGLILLPIVGNAAEHATAVTVACKDKMDLAIGVAVGSSMQIALLVLPFCVILGWIMGLDAMTLDFDVFQVTVLFVAVLLVNYLIADGKSHWLEGILLNALYVIIAVCAWYYPTKKTPAP